MSNRNLFNTLLIVAVSIGLTSCGIFRKGNKKNKNKKSDTAIVTAKDTSQPTVVVNVNPNLDKNLVEKYSPIWKNEIAFNTFSGKAKCHYEGAGQNHDFTANIRMKKNDAAWIMVSALGGIVQVARAYITPDSFSMINYLEKSSISLKIEEVNKVLPFPVDFTMLQNLFIGNALRTDGQVVDAKAANDMTTLIVKKEKLNQEISISNISNSISLLKVYVDNDNSEALVRYNNYRTIDNRNFPQDRVVNVSNKGEQHLLEMNFSDAKFDVPVEMPFSIPKNYSKK